MRGISVICRGFFYLNCLYITYRYEYFAEVNWKLTFSQDDLLLAWAYCCVLYTFILTPFALVLICCFSGRKIYSFPKRLISELLSRSSDECLVYFYWMHACKIVGSVVAQP